MADAKLDYWDGKSSKKARPAGWIMDDWAAWLVFVILIWMGIMVFVPRYGSRNDPKIRDAKESVSMLKTALQLFELQNGRFPATNEGLGVLIKNPGGLPNWKRTLDLNTVPLDPWDRAFVYRTPGTNDKDFDLYSVGPDGVDGTADDVHDVDMSVAKPYTCPSTRNSP